MYQSTRHRFLVHPPTCAPLRLALLLLVGPCSGRCPCWLRLPLFVMPLPHAWPLGRARLQEVYAVPRHLTPVTLLYGPIPPRPLRGGLPGRERACDVHQYRVVNLASLLYPWGRRFQ